jgi:BRCA1-associated protein
MRAYHIRIYLTPKHEISRSQQYSSSSTFVPTSIWQHLPSHTLKHSTRRETREPPIGESSDYRYGSLRLEWIDFENMNFAQAARGA